MSDLVKKYKEVLVPLKPGEDFPNVEGMYLSTNSLNKLFRDKYPLGYTKTVITDYVSGEYVTVTCDVYAEEGVMIASRSKTKLFSNATPEEEEGKIEQAQNNAIWKALTAAGLGLDFAIQSEIAGSKEKLAIVKKLAEDDAAVFDTDAIGKVSEQELFDGAITMKAANDLKKAKKTLPENVIDLGDVERPEPEAISENATSDDDVFDPFAAEGVLPPEPKAEVSEEADEPEAEEPAETEPEEEPEAVQEQEEEPVEEKTEEPEETEVSIPTENDVYVICKEDFANERYARKYAGKTLMEVSREELEAILSYGEKAITKDFTEKIQAYLKSGVAA